mmetsp:Transcript_49445/g.128994  ORF Transcript_49445/g.128994 Transcript_49445/m.128994 type:complete len:204 (+) Transcript_49445:2070-2681(+)
MGYHTSEIRRREFDHEKARRHCCIDERVEEDGDRGNPPLVLIACADLVEPEDVHDHCNEATDHREDGNRQGACVAVQAIAVSTRISVQPGLGTEDFAAFRGEAGALNSRLRVDAHHEDVAWKIASRGEPEAVANQVDLPDIDVIACAIGADDTRPRIATGAYTAWAVVLSPQRHTMPARTIGYVVEVPQRLELIGPLVARRDG